jgi:hypothetical protein
MRTDVCTQVRLQIIHHSVITQCIPLQYSTAIIVIFLVSPSQKAPLCASGRELKSGLEQVSHMVGGTACGSREVPAEGMPPSQCKQNQTCLISRLLSAEQPVHGMQQCCTIQAWDGACTLPADSTSTAHLQHPAT